MLRNTSRFASIIVSKPYTLLVIRFSYVEVVVLVIVVEVVVVATAIASLSLCENKSFDGLIDRVISGRCLVRQTDYYGVSSGMLDENYPLMLFSSTRIFAYALVQMLTKFSQR